MDVKQQTRQCLEYVKNKHEMMGASLKHIVMFRYYLPHREDVFDMRDEMYRFFEEFEPDLRAHPRPAKHRLSCHDRNDSGRNTAKSGRWWSWPSSRQYGFESAGLRARLSADDPVGAAF